MLAGLFPWTPLATLVLRPKTYDDVRVRFLAGWLIFALVFFSISQNKLPGYVLPLLPALAVILAVGLDKTGKSFPWWISVNALPLAALPLIVALLPDAFLSGIRKAPLTLAPGFWPVTIALALAGTAWWLAWREKAVAAVLTIGLAAGLGVLYVKNRALPPLDDRVSVRSFWRANQTQAASACIDPIVRREWAYGLHYYAQSPLKECPGTEGHRISVVDGRLMITSR